MAISLLPLGVIKAVHSPFIKAIIGDVVLGRCTYVTLGHAMTVGLLATCRHVGIYKRW